MLSQKVIRVSEEFGDEPIEVPLENDGTLLLSTLNSAFPNATGIKFRNPVNNCLRAVKLENNKFYSPGIGIDDGWESSKIQYYCVFPKINVTEDTAAVATSASSSYLNEQKGSSSSNSSIQNMSANGSSSGGGGGSSGAQPKTVDLIVLNLSANTTEEGLRDYFESKFGPLLMVELKRDRKTGSSRRFAFIRFHNYKEQMKALQQLRHKIDNQQIRLALPDFRDPSELYQENKCFIGRVNEQIKAGDLREFFSQFGDIVEISYPKKFKGYAFITFADAEIAKKICGNDFIVKGYSLCVSKSTHGGSKNKEPYQQQQHPYAQQQYPHNNYQAQQDFTQDWNGSNWFQGQQQQQQQQRDWMSGQQKYITSPLNSNYGNGNQMNPMVNALSLAMQHANQILHGGYNQYNRNNNNGTALWHPQQNNPNKNNNVNKKNKQKKKNNAAKKNKDGQDLSKRLEKQGDDNEEDDAGDTADVVVEEVSKIRLSDEAENKDLKQEA